MIKTALGATTIIFLIAIVLVVAYTQPATALTNNPAPTVTFDENAATISWAPQIGAQSYRVGWTTYPAIDKANDDDVPWTERFAYTNVRASVYTHKVQPLDHSTKHAFVVGTRSSDGSYTWSEWTTVTSPAPLCKCIAPGTGSGLKPPPPPPTTQPTQTPEATVRPNGSTAGDGNRSIIVSPEALSSTSTISISGTSYIQNSSVEVVHIANADTPSNLDLTFSLHPSAMYEYLRSFGDVIHTVTTDADGSFSTSITVDAQTFKPGANYIAAKQAGLNGLSSASFRFVYAE